MNIEELEVYLTPSGLGRAAIVRRSDGLLCIYVHWLLAAELRGGSFAPGGTTSWVNDNTPLSFILLKRPSVLLPLFLLSVTSVCEPSMDQEFTEGQEWSINCVPQSTAKVIIGRVEPCKNKIAVHVSIVDIPIPEEAEEIHIREIAHIPSFSIHRRLA